jgi:GTP-binding protein EngB required for normal cell division
MRLDCIFSCLLICKPIFRAQFLLEEGLRVVVVATKADKLSKSELMQLPQRVRGWLAPSVRVALGGGSAVEAQRAASALPVVLSSAATGLGKASIWHALHDNLLADEDEINGEVQSDSEAG